MWHGSRAVASEGTVIELGRLVGRHGVVGRLVSGILCIFDVVHDHASVWTATAVPNTPLPTTPLPNPPRPNPFTVALAPTAAATAVPHATRLATASTRGPAALRAPPA